MRSDKYNEDRPVTETPGNEPPAETPGKDPGLDLDQQTLDEMNSLHMDPLNDDEIADVIASAEADLRKAEQNAEDNAGQKYETDEQEKEDLSTMPSSDTKESDDSLSSDSDKESAASDRENSADPDTKEDLSSPEETPDSEDTQQKAAEPDIPESKETTPSFPAPEEADSAAHTEHPAGENMAEKFEHFIHRSDTDPAEEDRPRGIRYWSRPKKIIIGILLAILILIAGIAAYAIAVISTAPKIDTSQIYTILAQSSTLYDDSGKTIDSVYSGENRKNIKYSQLPKNLINAFVALEDKTFWKHHGFNFVRILGAIKSSVFSGGSVSGTSTLTQQLARNVFLKSSMSEHTMRRKIIEAWYTVQLEKNLSKKEIITAYLNTVYLGFNSNGVEAASEAYFNKSASKLTLPQCALLASLVQSPTKFAPVELVSSGSKLGSNTTILKTTTMGIYVMNDLSKDRRLTCLKLMKDQGYVSDAEYQQAKNTPLKSMLNPQYDTGSAKHGYFTDYVVEQVIKDLQKKNKLTYNEAWEKVYKGGLKIHTTMSTKAQKVVEKEFKNNANFPSPYSIRYDGYGNILDSSGNVALFAKKNILSGKKFVFTSNEARVNADGSVTILKDRRVKIYTTTSNNKTDYSLEFPSMYQFSNGHLYSISGGYINIPQEYKSMDSSGNIVVSAKYINSDAGKQVIRVKGNQVIIPKTGFTLNQSVIQPQSAMTIIENKTGYVKAMVGGRKTNGKMLYNRAVETRQPGSSIKPLAVYSAALEQSAEEAKAGKPHQFHNYGIDSQGASGWGKYITAGSTVLDEKTVIQGKVWPQNDGGGYSGRQTLRTALKHSLNTCAVKIWYQVGLNYSRNMVKKYGISSLDTKGAVSDNNAAALALGGMTNGVSTLEMANAYTVFPNNGTKTTDPICYTKVEDSNGKTLLTGSSKRVRVLDKGVAWIMKDIMHGVTTAGGTGVNAAIPGVQVCGKTGTTSNQYDIWFDGYTPSYTASLWIGNDINIKLTSKSSMAAALWGKVMGQIPAAKKGSYKAMPSDVVRTNGEYYVKGTYSYSDYQNSMVTVKVCNESGMLATSSCPSTTTKTLPKNQAPTTYCTIHNNDPDNNPVSPNTDQTNKENQNRNNGNVSNRTDNNNTNNQNQQKSNGQ